MTGQKYSAGETTAGSDRRRSCVHRHESGRCSDGRTEIQRLAESAQLLTDGHELHLAGARMIPDRLHNIAEQYTDAANL